MSKKLAVAVMSAVTALAIVVPVGSASAGTANLGTRACYVTVDYWELDLEVKPTSPYVTYSLTGTIGAGVHCPVPPPPYLGDLISWT